MDEDVEVEVGCGHHEFESVHLLGEGGVRGVEKCGDYGEDVLFCGVWVVRGDDREDCY